MIDERFDRDLRRVLDDIAGDEAPLALRYRLSEVTSQPTIDQRPWLSGVLRLASAAAVLVVAVALTVVVPLLGAALTPSPSPLLSPPASVAPAPSTSPGPNPSPTPSASPAPSASPPPSVTPAPSITPGPSLGPVAAWTGLSWSSDSAALPPEDSDIGVVVAWGGRYVGIGQHDTGDAYAPAFFTSPDGLHWTLVQEVAGCGVVATEAPDPCGGRLDRLVPVADALLAVTDQAGPSCTTDTEPCGVPTVWRTVDGTHWTQVHSPTWDAAWASGGRLLSIAAGAPGILAVGADADDAPIALFTADARTWTAVSSPAFDRAVFRDVTASLDGFVIVGRSGDPDGWASGEPSAPWGVGAPAAWLSADGLTWTAADVDGRSFAGAELSDVGAGADGLFALGTTPDSVAGMAPKAGWASADGRTWRMIGDGYERPFGWRLASDGTHLVTMASGTTETGAWAVGYWASTDGETWTQLTSTRPVEPPPSDVDGLPWYSFWVAPDGIVQSQGGAVLQAFSFGTATGP